MGNGSDFFVKKRILEKKSLRLSTSQLREKVPPASFMTHTAPCGVLTISRSKFVVLGAPEPIVYVVEVNFANNRMYDRLNSP